MLIDSFLDYLRFEKNYSGKTIVSYGIDLAQFEEFAKNEGHTLLEADAGLIRQWVISMMDEKTGYTSTSVNRKLSSLRSFYKFLLKKKEIEGDPTWKVIGPKNKKPLPFFLKENEMNRLLDETDFGSGFGGCRDRMVIEMFYATGMRRAELVALDDADIDFDSSLIKVTGKRNKQRLIPFGQGLRESLLNYIKVRNETIPAGPGAFFVKENGERTYDGMIYNLVKRHLSKVVTLKKRSPHVLRHTFATNMLNHDADLGAVKELLGHSKLSATEVYTHTTFEELKKVYNQAHPRA